jgi:hypothetical protein
MQKCERASNKNYNTSYYGRITTENNRQGARKISVKCLDSSIKGIDSKFGRTLKQHRFKIVINWR